MISLRIADLPLRLHPDFSGHCAAFIADETDPPVISIFRASALPECHGVRFAEGSVDRLLQRGNELLTANADWTSATLHCLQYSDPYYVLPLAAICACFARFSTVLLHGSFVDYEGNGILFVGPSGIGKTTQAQLWNRHLNADIVNGDKVFLRCRDEKIRAYGLPWKGSSPYCLNRSAPVSGIVVLRQSQTNCIRRLSSLECMEHFMPHVFLPHWDKGCVELALDTIDQILRQVPVWLLECRPDREAVLLTKQTILK